VLDEEIKTDLPNVILLAGSVTDTWHDAEVYQATFSGGDKSIP
jgi:hypothetical protein